MVIQARERRDVGVILQSGFERVSNGSEGRLFVERGWDRARGGRRGGGRDGGLGSVCKGSAWGMVEKRVIGGKRIASRVRAEETSFGGYRRRRGDDGR